MELETQILKLIDQEESEQEKLQRLLDEKKIIDEWSINFKNFKSHLANKSLRHIQDFTNLYLKEMGSNISIDVDGYRMLANKKLKEEITTTVNKDGFPVVGGYGKFSKGERGGVDICSVIGLKELIDLNSPTGGLDLLVCDEVLDAVDTLGIESIITSCQGLGKTLMIVSQNEINTLPNYTLTIKKENNISTIL